MKVKAVSGPAKVLDVFHQVQLVAAKIKATGSISLPEDEEYVALIGSHLAKEVMREWWKSKKSGWSNFYLFLEESASTAKEEITAESIMSALYSASDKPNKCSMCHKNHSGQCQKIRNAAVVQGADKMCPVCNKAAYKYKAKSGAEGI